MASGSGRKRRSSGVGFERWSEPLLPWEHYLRRVARSALTGTSVVLVSLVGGMWGYHGFEGLGWLDAFVNAAMILSGMGPLAQPHSTGGKVFAGCYALYSGFAVLVVASIVLQPVVHRFLHKFHLEQGSEN